MRNEAEIMEGFRMEAVQAIIDGHGGIEALKENYIRIENEPYMPLVIEWVGSGPHQTELVSVASLFSHPIVYNLRQRCGIKGVAEAEEVVATRPDDDRDVMSRKPLLPDL